MFSNKQWVDEAFREDQIAWTQTSGDRHLRAVGVSAAEAASVYVPLVPAATQHVAEPHARRAAFAVPAEACRSLQRASAPAPGQPAPPGARPDRPPTRRRRDGGRMT
jgi:hypothetical protein